MFGSWIVDVFFHAFELIGVCAEFGGVAPQRLVEFLQAPVSEGEGAAASSCDLFCFQVVEAIEAHDGVECDSAVSLAGIDYLHECDGFSEHLLYVDWLWP